MALMIAGIANGSFSVITVAQVRKELSKRNVKKKKELRPSTGPHVSMKAISC